MGRGLLLDEGPHWHTQRRKVRWAIQQLDLERQAKAVLRYARRALADYCRHGTDIAAAFDWLAFALNVHLLLGQEAEQVVDGLHQAACELHAIGIHELARWSLAPDWLPLRSKARLRAAMQHYEEVLLSAARRRLAAPHRDLLSLLLTAHVRQGGTTGMSPRQARDEAANLLMAGKETASATLTFACWLLAHHPAVQEQSAPEVAQALSGCRAGSPDLARLSYTQMIVKETMLLYPPVYIMARHVRHPIAADGYQLPRYSQAMLPVFAIHRDPRRFDAPLNSIPAASSQKRSAVASRTPTSRAVRDRAPAWE